MRVDADAALDQAADARPLVPVLIGAASRAERPRCRRASASRPSAWSRETRSASPATHAGRVGDRRAAGRRATSSQRQQVTPPLPGVHQRGAVALPGFAFVHGLAGDRGRAMHHENETRQRRQLELRRSRRSTARPRKAATRDAWRSPGPGRGQSQQAAAAAQKQSPARGRALPVNCGRAGIMWRRRSGLASTSGARSDRGHGRRCGR